MDIGKTYKRKVKKISIFKKNKFILSTYKYGFLNATQVQFSGEMYINNARPNPIKIKKINYVFIYIEI